MQYKWAGVALAILVSCLGTAWGRTWTSASGQFQVEAELVEARADGTVVLRRADGQMLEIHSGKLSAADQDFLRGLANKEPKPPLSPPDRPQALLKPPTEAEIASKSTELQTLLAADYKEAKANAEGREKLCDKLMGLARESVKKDPTSAYVCAIEATNLAAESGNVEEAIASLDWLRGQFELPDALAKKTELVGRAKIDSMSPEALAGFVAIVAELMGAAEDAADYDATMELGRVAMRAARKSRDPALIAKVQERGKQLNDQRPFFEAAARAKQTLATTPDDPAASADLGRFLCFLRGRWDEGLRRLAAGNDAELSAIAKQDLAAPKTAQDRIALADAWWTMAESPKYAALPEIKNRAIHWYRQAVAETSGLDKLRIEKRIAAAPDSPADGGASETVAATRSVVKLDPAGAIPVIRGLTFFDLLPGGRLLVAANGDMETLVWDIARRKQRASIRGRIRVCSVGGVSGGEKLALGDYRGVVRIYNLRGKQLGELESSGTTVTALAVSADQKMLAVGCERSDVHLWDAVTLKKQATFSMESAPGRTTSIKDFWFSPDGRTLAVADWHSRVCIWDIAESKKRAEFQAIDGAFLVPRFSPDGTMLASSTRDQAFKVCRLADQQIVATFEGFDTTTNSVAWLGDSRHLAGCAGRVVKVWDVVEKKELVSVPVVGLTSLRATDDGSLLVGHNGPAQALQIIKVRRR